MPNLSRTCHAVGVADRYGTAVHVVDFWINLKMVAAIENLAGKGFVKLPKIDVCCLYTKKPGQSDAILLELAMALGRGLRKDQWRNALPLADSRSRR